MLFAFGDNRIPKTETASLVEDICQQQMAEIVTRASEVTQTRGASEIGIEDLLFLMRRSPVKIQRLVQVNKSKFCENPLSFKLSTFNPIISIDDLSQLLIS